MKFLGKCFKFSLQSKKCVIGVLSGKMNLNNSRTTVNIASSINELKEANDSNNLNAECVPILHRNLNFTNKYIKNREIWVENMDTIKEEKKGLIELNSNIFGVMPRLDLIHTNVKWQILYRKVILHSAKTRAEMRGGGRKPHPQKGLGKARQGSIRAPHMINGGICHGPRNPTSYFYMIPFSVRLHGLISTLSVKFAQDDLHIVNNLHIPTQDSQYVTDLIEERNWGPSVLMVNDIDMMPRNITLATEDIGYVTLMPLYGLNVYGMLKHDTLIMTLSALNDLENKLTTILNSANPLDDNKFYNK